MIVVTDPGLRQEPRQIAAALSERRIPFRLHTSAYFDPSGFSVRTARALPHGVGRRAADILLRRHDAAIRRDSVRAWLFPDVLGRAMHALSATEATSYVVVNNSFDRFVSRLIPAGTELVVAMQGSALYTIRRAHRLGAVAVLIANSADPAAESRLVAAEETRLGLTPKRGVGCSATRLAERIATEQDEADLILGNSELTRRSLVARGLDERKVVAAPLGVDIELFSPRPRRRDPAAPACVMYVGSLQARKGVVHLARAVQALREEGRR